MSPRGRTADAVLAWHGAGPGREAVRRPYYPNTVIKPVSEFPRAVLPVWVSYRRLQFLLSVKIRSGPFRWWG